MDKVITLLSGKLDSMILDYKKKISMLSQWQIDKALPHQIKIQPAEQKIQFLVERFKSTNPIYTLLSDDKSTLESRKYSPQNKLKVLNVDPRFLESNGLSEIQVEEFLKFIDQVRELFKD